MSQTRPHIPDVVEWIREYYAKPDNSVGGVLHIVLDDGNIEDAHVEWCVEEARELGDVEGEKLAQTIAYMTTTQRRKLSRMSFYPWLSP